MLVHPNCSFFTRIVPCKIHSRSRSAIRKLDPRICRRLAATASPEPGEESAAGGDSENQWKLPASGSDTDWREFRARLIKGETTNAPAGKALDEPGRSDDEGDMWAHPISSPETGCLLLAHPHMFQANQVYFNQAVILITSHDESGTTGVILNKPMEHLIGQLSGMEELWPEFAGNRLFLGGDVGKSDGRNVMQLIHASQELASKSKSVEIVKGIYLGGFQAAKMAVRREEMDPIKNCRWYCQYAGWAPGQLQREVEAGVWFTAAASKDMIFHPSCLENGSRHWHSVLRGMGGDYKKLSDDILVDPQAREAVWGKEHFIKSRQSETEADSPDDLQP